MGQFHLTMLSTELSCFMEYSAGFRKIVTEARPYVNELTVEQARERLAQNPQAVLLDVREDHEWQLGHAAQAVHLGKGVLERDIEQMFPDWGREIIMYCGGGYRCILAAITARKLGYRNVSSLIGGYKALLSAHWPIKTGN